MLASMCRRGGLAAIALISGLAACSGDTTLAPPDGTRCTAGRIAVGDTVTGEIVTDGCLLWNDYEYDERVSESWTLRTEANKVYIVRVKPVAVNGGTNTLDAAVWVFGRNDAGDPMFITGQNATYTNPDPGGASAVEMVIPSRRAQTLSVRVAADDAGDVGGYELTVDECQLRSVAIGVATPALALDDGCTLYTFGGLSPSPVAFYSFDAQPNVSYSITGTRASGTATFRMSLRGPREDFSCYTDACQSVLGTSATGTGPYTLNRTPTLEAGYTIVVGQGSAGTLSTTVTVAPNPVVAASSTHQR